MKNYRSISCYAGLIFLIAIITVGCIVILFSLGFDAVVFAAIVWLVFISFLVPIAVSSRPAFLIAYLDENGITSKMFGRTMCTYRWEEITYCGIFFSFGYSILEGRRPYIVLSTRAPQSKNHVARSKNYKDEIIIRVTPKNQAKLCQYLKKMNAPLPLNVSFECLFSMSKKGYEIIKNSNGEWE